MQEALQLASQNGVRAAKQFLLDETNAGLLKVQKNWAVLRDSLMPGQEVAGRDTVPAVTASVSLPTSMVVSGCALMLWYQSGFVGAPALGAKITYRPPSSR